MKKLMKRLVVLGCLLGLCMFSLPVFAADCTQFSQNIPVFTTMPDWNDPFLPDEFIIIEEHLADKNSIVPYAYVEDLVVSYTHFVSNTGAVTNGNYQYQRFRFLNGYTSSTKLTKVKTYWNGTEYSATVTYNFY